MDILWQEMLTLRSGRVCLGFAIHHPGIEHGMQSGNP